MRRGSFVFPLVLILIGVLFLIDNLNPGFRVFSIVGKYWPFLLIGWGLLRSVELVAAYQQGRRLPQAGLNGGEWFLAIFLAFVGGGITGYNRLTEGTWANKVTMRGLDVFGEAYDFPLQGSINTTGANRILIDNLRGNTRIVAADTTEVQVTGRTTVRAFDEAQGKRASEDAKLEIVNEAGQIIIRTNQTKVSSDSRISADLDIIAPKGFAVECRGRYGDFDVTGFTGDIDVRSDNAGVRLEDIAGSARLDLGQSDIVRATNVKGNIDIKGRGSDLELENIDGAVTVLASYYGDLMFRNIAKQTRYESNNSNIVFEKIPGHVRFSRGDLTAIKVVGPIRIKSNSKDVRMSEFTNGADIDVHRGDVEIFPGSANFGRISVKTGNGDIELGLVEDAKLNIRANTNRGEIENDFSGVLTTEKDGRGARLQGSVGQGPEVVVSSNRGTIVIRKTTPGSPGWDEPDPVSPPKAPRAPTAPKVTQQ